MQGQFVGNKAKGRKVQKYVCVTGGKKCWFFGKFGVFCVLVTLF